ncbi:hypothetical protein EXIGLDRAFT_336667 [Exidia glandulosa HHB12029]|uniref:C2H2-type domain-containing protein n=1 Tax=Exidia glandulosa HHB12029 TaxID=1314781 RepID=A0A165ZHB2_EXIGL|nr:hypothetical protein EXIGLDRAFT_336667 [Exidia glandulosa HHB12029]
MTMSLLLFPSIATATVKVAATRLTTTTGSLPVQLACTDCLASFLQRRGLAEHILLSLPFSRVPIPTASDWTCCFHRRRFRMRLADFEDIVITTLSLRISLYRSISMACETLS